MKTQCLACLSMLAMVLTALPAAATHNWGQVRAYICRRAPAPPVVDGLLDDPCWQQAEPAAGFVAEGAEQDAPADPQTTLRVAYDDQALYLAFECREPNLAAVTRERRGRDFDVYNEDMVGVLLDVGHRRQGHYDLELAVSAAGTLYDFGWGQEEAWNGQWTAAVSRDEQAGLWRAELRLPAADTRQPPRRGDIWGMQALRWRHAAGKEEPMLWSAVPTRTGQEMWSAPAFGHLLFDTGDSLVKSHVAALARRLRSARPEAEALARGRPQADALAALYARLEALQARAALGSRLTGDQWWQCFAEGDLLVRELDELIWPLRIEKLLEE